MPLRLSRRRVSTRRRRASRRSSKRRSTRKSRHSKRRSTRSSRRRSTRKSRRSKRRSTRSSKRRSTRKSRRSKHLSKRRSTRRRSHSSSGGAKRGPARRGMEYIMERKRGTTKKRRGTTKKRRGTTKKRRVADDCCCHTKNGKPCGLYVGKSGDTERHLCWRHLKCSSPLTGAIGLRRKCSARSKSRSRSRSVSPRPLSRRSSSPRPLSRRSSSPPLVPPRSSRRSSPKVSPPPVPARSMSSSSKKMEELAKLFDPATDKLLGDGGAVTQNRSINADSIAWGLRHKNQVIHSFKNNKKIPRQQLTEVEKDESAIIDEVLKIPRMRERFGGIEMIEKARKGMGGGPFTDWIKGGEPVYYVPKK